MHGTQQFHNSFSRTISRAATLALAIIFFVLALVLVVPQFAQAQTFNVLYNFTGGADGAQPYAGVTIDRAGNLYGTTPRYGNLGYGGVYRLVHKSSGWVFQPLYSFTGGSDGGHPFSVVFIGADGGLYGTSAAGGSSDCNDMGWSGCGTVFNLRPMLTVCRSASCPWTETVLHRFTGGNDGAFARSNVIADPAGNLYGTTVFGGIYSACDSIYGKGCGTVYELTPSKGGWNETVLWNFGQGNDGQAPYSGVILDKSGNLYGTTPYGGQSGYGTVFALTPSGSGWTETVLYHFQSGNDGYWPYAGLVADPSGNLYGATSNGGQAAGGTVFQLTPSNGSWAFTVLHDFPGPLGYNTGPNDTLVMDKAGSLYGTTHGQQGIDGDWGTVFKLTPSNGAWTYTLLHAFTGGSDGYTPNGVILDSAGNLYGTTENDGGKYGYGVVFQITP